MSKRSKKKKRQAPETMRVVEPKAEEVPDSKPPGANGKRILLRALLIVLAGLWVFAPALRGDWLWDDNRLITDNFQLRTLDGLWNIWFAAPSTASDYWPLSWTVLWIEWHLWENHPLGYHLCSLVLHLCSGFLIWRLFNRLGLRGGWLGGLLFVVHPLAVESAAWITEIKNTLSLPLFLLSCDAWLDGEQGRGKSGYLRSILYYLAAMLAKTSTVMLPAVLLLYAWWKRGTITWRDVKRTIPYGVIALALGLLTIYFQSHGPEADAIKMGSYSAQLLGAGMAVCFYLGKFLWPTELLPIYPGWTLETPTLIQVLPIPLLAALVFGLWTRRKSWGRSALFGFGFFVLNLLPVLGFIKMAYLRISPVADQFVYLPIIGLIGLVVAVWGRAEERLPPAFRPAGVGIVAMVFALLAWESHGYAGLYINEETLWTYTLQRNSQSYIAHNNLGAVLLEKGRLPEAMDQFQQALKINPDYPGSHNNLGLCFQKSGRVAEAIGQFKQALRLNPDFAEAHNALGNILRQNGRVPEAMDQFKQVLELNPDDVDAHNDLGIALFQKGQVDEAIAQFQQALEIDTNHAEASYNLGFALLQKGQVDEAIAQLQKTLEIKPDYPEALSKLGIALFQKGQVNEGIARFQKALEIDPDFAVAHYNLGIALFQTGQVDAAIAEVQEAVRLNPADSDAQNALAKMKRMATQRATHK